MKKKSHKRMMDGGMAGARDKMARGPKAMGGGSRDRQMPSGPMGRGGRSSEFDDIIARRRAAPGAMAGRPAPAKPMGRGDMVETMPIEPPVKAMPVDRPAPRMPPEMMDRVGRAMAMQRQGGAGRAPEEMMRRQVMRKGGKVQGKKMRGGGLARKGVGMALAAGGLAKRAGGCAKRGKTRGKMV